MRHFVNKTKTIGLEQFPLVFGLLYDRTPVHDAYKIFVLAFSTFLPNKVFFYLKVILEAKEYCQPVEQPVPKARIYYLLNST